MSPSDAQPWCRSRRTAASSVASSVVTAPPSPVVTILRGWKERHAATPSEPHGVSRYRAPSAPAASSRSATSCGTAVCSASHSTGRPKRWTAMAARVRGVTAAATAAESTLNVSGSTSTSTACAPQSSTTFAVAGNVYAGTTTSSPGPISRASSARCSAAVPDETTAACAVPTARASASSSSSTFRPIVSCPLPTTSASAASSSSPTSGRASRIARAPGRLPLMPGGARLRGSLTTLAARGSAGPYLSYCALRPRTASDAPGTREDRSRGRCSELLAIPRDRPLESLVEVHLGLEPEQRPRLRDVRDPELDVGVVERLEHDLARAAGQPLHALREVVDRDRGARVPDVEALPHGARMLEGEQRSVDHVVDVAPSADLGAVAVDRQVLAGERRLDERADRAPADLTGPVDVERPHRGRGQAELGVVRVGHVLAGELRHGVGPARLADRADRGHVCLLHVERVLAEDLARREVDEPFQRVARRERRLEDVVGADDVDPHRAHRAFEDGVHPRDPRAVDDVRRVAHELLESFELEDVRVHEREVRVPRERRPAERVAVEVVEGDDLVLLH